MKNSKYEYLDHTADVQLHSWGESLEEVISNCLISMYGYMVGELSTVKEVYSMDFYATGSDLCSLVYNILNDCLYHFSAEPYFVGQKCEVLSIENQTEDETKNYNLKDEEEGSVKNKESELLSIHLRVWGESFELDRHKGGTEIKAITYSNLQVTKPLTNTAKKSLEKNFEKDERNEGLTKEGDKLYEKHDNEFNIFVIVDI